MHRSREGESDGFGDPGVVEKVYDAEVDGHPVVVDKKQLVHVAQEVPLIGHEDARLVSKDAVVAHDFLEDLPANVGIQGTQRVIQQVDVALVVGGTCQGEPLLLTATQSFTLLPDLGEVSGWQTIQVVRQLAGGQHVLVAVFVHLLPIQDVVTDGHVVHARHLGHIPHATHDV